MAELVPISDSESDFTSTSSDFISDENIVNGEPVQTISLRNDVICRSGVREGTLEELKDYVKNIMNNEKGGILLESLGKLKPKLDIAFPLMSSYKEGSEYKRVKVLKETPPEVLLCKDETTQALFVLKKFHKQRTLFGAEFLLERKAETFCPQLLGVSKDANWVYVYLEYIEGGSLDCVKREYWEPFRIRQMTCGLLRALVKFHSLPAVHYDLKLSNIAIRSLHSPSSVIVIDLDSIQTPFNHFREEGCTVYYHSPWHRNIIAGVKQRIADMISLGDYKNPGYNKELELVDLWAVYCVIITVVCGSQVWYKEHVSISRGCPNRRKHTCSCSTCIYQLEEVIKNKWQEILSEYVSKFMKMHPGDPDATLLKKLLTYFGKYVHRATAEEALKIVTGVKEIEEISEQAQDAGGTSALV